MEWGRTISRDIVIAHHEAAHAVTAEHLAPTSVLSVCIDGPTPDAGPQAWDALGMCSWLRKRFPTDLEQGVAIWASRPGEGLVAELVDPMDTPYVGDDALFAEFVPPRLRLWASDRAIEIVRGNERRIRRLAAELLEHRMLDGDRVRQVIEETHA